MMLPALWSDPGTMQIIHIGVSGSDGQSYRIIERLA
jgi:hypothetical protein